MIKKIVLIIIIALLSIWGKFIDRFNMIDSIFKKIEGSVINALMYKENQEYLLQFDYQAIEYDLKKICGDYTCKLTKKTPTSFYLTIEVEYLFLFESKTTKFYLKKGDLYEKFN